MKIKYWDFKREYIRNKKNYLKEIDKTLLSKSLILGDQVKSFEKNISKYIGFRYGVGVNSGTDALIISLMSIGIKRGDQIITTSNTAIPTISAIVSVGAKPIYVDVKDEDYLINENLIERNISKKTKAIIIVHLYGQSPNLKKIIRICKKYNIKIIEDCAQSFGAKYFSKKLGSFGDVSAFSFYPTKVLGTFGDGGMILTNNKKIFENCKMLRFYGIKKDYFSKKHGINSRLDEIHASILNFKIKQVDKKIKLRRSIANFYNKNINNKKIILPKENENTFHVYYNYVIRSKKRNKLKKHLSKYGVETKVVYPHPVHRMKPYANFAKTNTNLKVTEKLSKEILSLPIYPELKKLELKKIIKTINSFK